MLTLLDADGVAHRLPAAGLTVDAAALAAATGWELKPEGLCKGEVCVPILGRDVEIGEGMVDLVEWAAALRMQLAVDIEHSIAAITPPSAERAVTAGSGRMLNLTLPDLEGNPVSFQRFRGTKRMLLAWASW